MATAPSQVRQNYHRECEAAINEQINVKLYTSYVYLSMAYHYDREDVNLKNFAGYFLHHSHKRREQGEILLKLQNQHGGRTQLQDIRKPDLNDWGNGLNAIEYAFCFEKSINESLLDLHHIAIEKHDPQLCDFLERYFVFEQVRIIKELGHHVNNLRQLRASGSSLAEYVFHCSILSDGDSE